MLYSKPDASTLTERSSIAMARTDPPRYRISSRLGDFGLRGQCLEENGIDA
jgi:hypothetical protein